MVSKGMAASSSCLKQGSVPMDNIRVTPEATYEAVVADPKLFMGSLERLHSRLGTKFMVPIIGGRDLDLHKLFVEVTSRGGINKILHERRWKEVTATFVFPPTATNASYVLRKYYFSLLNNYEQIYFFRSNSHIPPDSLHTQSGAPGLMQGGIRPPQELQALAFTPQPRINIGGVLNGANVIGVVDGKFEDGYLVTVTMGSEKLKGVLYQLVPENTVAAHHQTPQQSHHGGFPNTWNNNGRYPQGVVTGGVTKRRRRRKKSEIKRRDPAHPKPNRSGYNFFFAEQHARLKPLHPGKDREISRMIGELWNKLNEQERLVYQGKAMEDKERYRTEMEDYREKLRTGQLISNAVPLQQRLPEQNVEIAEVPMEEAEEEAEEEDEEEEEGDSSSDSGESEPHSDAEMEEPSLTPSGLNLNPNPSEIVVAAPKEKASDVVVMETSPGKKYEAPAVVVAAQQN